MRKKSAGRMCGSVVSAGVLAMLVGGCPTANDGDPNGGGGEVSFAEDIQPIFNARCVICHNENGIAAFEGIDMFLTRNDAYTSLVDQPSAQDPNRVLVVPGDADESLLYQKVALDDPPLGDRMPPGGQLSDAQVERIRRWIEAGAQDN